MSPTGGTFLNLTKGSFFPFFLVKIQPRFFPVGNLLVLPNKIVFFFGFFPSPPFWTGIFYRCTVRLSLGRLKLPLLAAYKREDWFAGSPAAVCTCKAPRPPPTVDLLVHPFFFSEKSPTPLLPVRLLFRFGYRAAPPPRARIGTFLPHLDDRSPPLRRGLLFPFSFFTKDFLSSPFFRFCWDGSFLA